jgi:uncharacterized protein
VPADGDGCLRADSIVMAIGSDDLGRFAVAGVVDTHCHLASSAGPEGLDDQQRLIASMDRAGLDHAIVLPYPHLTDFRTEHDAIGRAQREHVGRIYGCVCVPPQAGSETVRLEVERCIDEYGFRAIKFHPLHHWGGPQAPVADLLFAAGREYGLPVICHTGSGLPWSSPTQLIPAARRYPDVKFIAAHSGQNLFASDALVAVQECDNILLDSSWTSPYWLDRFLRVAGPDKVMFSSDLIINCVGEVAKWKSLELESTILHRALVETPREVFAL